MDDGQYAGRLLRADRRLLGFSGFNRKFGGFGVGIWTANLDRRIAGVRLVEGPGSENRIRFLGFVGVVGVCSVLERWQVCSVTSVGITRLLLVRLLRCVTMVLSSSESSCVSMSAMVKDCYPWKRWLQRQSVGSNVEMKAEFTRHLDQRVGLRVEEQF